MPARITARISLARRDATAANMCASVLANFGFVVLQTGSRGVSFEGSPSLFERVFHSGVEISSPNTHFISTPKIPHSLLRTVESVYFPTPPQRFP